MTMEEYSQSCKENDFEDRIQYTAKPSSKCENTIILIFLMAQSLLPSYPLLKKLYSSKTNKGFRRGKHEVQKQWTYPGVH